MRKILNFLLGTGLGGVIVVGCSGLFYKVVIVEDRGWNDAAAEVFVTPLNEVAPDSLLITAIITRSDDGRKRSVSLGDRRAKPLVSDALKALKERGPISVSVYESVSRGDDPVSLLVVINPKVDEKKK